MNTKNQIKPLLVTPKPIRGESPMGFLLRSSEMNGYESPYDILRYAGMNEDQVRSARPPLDMIAPLYGRPIEDFACLDINFGEIGNSKRWSIMGHILPSLYVNVKNARICPECVGENGYIDNFWYLRHALVCPVHRRKAIFSCPSCGKDLSWHRKGLLKCSCGQDLSALRGEIEDDQAVIDLLHFVRSKLWRSDPKGNVQSSTGFPMEALEQVSLGTLLGIIYRAESNKIGLANCQMTKLDRGMDALRNAARMLSRWPHGFYDHLESLPQHKINMESFNLHRQFHSVYSSFFRSGLPEEETAFLRKAFVSFGNDRWQKNGFIDIRIAKRAQEERRLVGISGLAKYLKVMPPTVMKYVKAGLIKGEPLESGKRVRQIFDLDKDVPFLPSSGKYFKQREAAMFLGIPVSLLQRLKSEGTYKIRRLGMGLGGYDEQDLIEFRESIVSKAPTTQDYDPATHISIDELLRKKLGGPAITAEVIANILIGKLEPCGHTGETIRDIIFMRNDVVLNEIEKLAA